MVWAEVTVTNVGAPPKLHVDTKVVPPPPCEDYTHTTTVGPLLQTQWGQAYPYNALCPTGTYSQGHKPTGCVATAIAQVLYYWRAPTTFGYEWNLMPLDYTDNGTTAIARLMLDAGTSVDMVYDDSGSYPSVAYHLPASIGSTSCSDALKNYFHYGSGTEGDFDQTTVVNNLNSSEPVILSATTDNNTILFWSWGTDGHTWVCDGYEATDFLYCANEGSPQIGGQYLYLHMNWGWNESFNPNNSNGWYMYNVWTVLNGSQTENYQYNQKMTYNIHP